MKERDAIGRVMARLYADRLRRTGRLPRGEETREMEKKARVAAKTAEVKKGRRG